DGLQQDLRYRVGTLALPDAWQVVQGAPALRLGRRPPELAAVQVRPERVHVPGRVLVGEAPPVAGRDDRGAGVAVVAAVPRDHLAAPGVQPRQPDRVLDGVGPAV